MDILKGIRVVDVTIWAFGPSVGAVMAQWGADVIKIEHPRIPDPMRGQGQAGPGDSLTYIHYNRGKRGIALDLGSDDGREVLYKLVDRADVFMTSYLTDTRKKLKIDVADIKARNPRIIYAKGTGRGPRGPVAERGGYDLASWWGRGTLADSAMRASGVGEPPGMTGHGDGMSGHTLAGGICAALFHRERTGESVVVDGSLMGTAIWFNGPAINAAGSGQPRGNPGPREDRSPLTNAYRTRDGRWIQLCMLSGDPDWVDLAPHLGRPDLATDPKFAKEAGRMQNRRELVGILDKIFAAKDYKEWQKTLMTTKGVWEPIQTAEDIHEDVQVAANNFIRKMRYPDGREIPMVVPGVLFNEDSGEVRPAPSWGQHTDEVLKELGMDSARIGQLRQKGVVR